MSNDKYDILFTLSTFKSGNVTLSFLRSLANLQANVLPVLVSPREDDLMWLAGQAPDVPAIYIHSDFNSLHMGRAYGFVYAVNNDIKARYLATCDDDIQFWPAAKKIVSRLDYASQAIPFSLMIFRSTHPQWDLGYTHIKDEIKVGVNWADGNCIFSKWQDNLDYGVIDALPTCPQSYFVEVEYGHRMRFLTGRPIIFDVSDMFYRHVFRADPEINYWRNMNSSDGIIAGNKFWERKFGITMDMQCDNTVHERLYNETTGHPDAIKNYKNHLLFEGEWNDWSKIYNKYAGQARVVCDNRRPKS